MFRVVIIQSENGKDVKNVDVVMKTEKMHEVLGRFLRIYGAPVILEEIHGITEYEYFNDVNKKSAMISIARVAEETKGDKIRHKTSQHWGKRSKSYAERHTPPPPPEPTEPDDERITELVTKGLLTRVSSYGY